MTLSFCPELDEMYRTHRAVGQSGRAFDNLAALSTPNNLLTLRSLMMSRKPASTLEVGMSFGGSALAIAASYRDLGHPPEGQHVAIDPYQQSVWDNCGAAVLDKAGLRGFVTLRQEPSSLALAALTSAVTLSAWIKPDNLNSGVVLTKETESGGWSYGFQFLSSGLLEWKVQHAGGFSGVDVGSLLPTGQWSHVAGTYDGAYVRLYLNGTLVSSWPASGAIVTGNRPLWIGTNRWQSWHFAGSFDEIRVYDRALSENEIQNDMTLAVDSTAPLQVTAFTPANGQVGLRTVAISAALSSPMDPASLTASTVRLETLGGTAVPATLSYASATRTVTLTPSTSLAALTPYRVTIKGGATGVAGTGGATLPADVAWLFTTAAPSGVGGFWAFEDGSGTAAADSSGNGNTGLLRNGPTWSTGRFGTGLTFDGVNDYVEVPDADTLDASTAVTMSAWIKPDNLNSGVVLTKEAESGGWSYGFQFLSSGLLEWKVQHTGGFTGVDLGSLLPTGQWSHVAGTYDGAFVRMYLNGTLVSSWPASGAIVTGNRPLWIGTNRWQSWHFAGGLDEIRIYDRALSAAEISDLVNTPIAPAPTTPTIAPPTGTYFTAQTVTLSTSGAPSIIRYTLDGTDPTSTSMPYTTPFTVSATTTITARAFPIGGWTPSLAANATLTISTTLDPPIATPPAGVFAASQQVSLSAASGATIRFTTDGTDPTDTSTIYTAPISVADGTVTIKAKAFHPSLNPSSVLSGTYTIDTVAPTITAHRLPSPLADWHRTPVTVSFFCADNIELASCNAPVEVNSEGAEQQVFGTAVDTAGRYTTVVETLNLDFTAPEITLISPAEESATTSTSISLTAQASDTLSGLASVKCDGVEATVVDGSVSCTVTLRPGRNDISVSARDAAGNNTSTGITVNRVGTVTAWFLTPTNPRMLVGEARTLSLLDNFGVRVTGATWTSSNDSVVSLSTDDPPMLNALAPGTSVVAVTNSDLTRTVAITVLDGDVIPEGTERWRVNSLTTTNIRRDPPIFGLPYVEGDPDAFIVETNASTLQSTVRPVSSAGEVAATIPAPGIPLFGDSFGGLVAGVPVSSTSCRAIFNEFEHCYTALVRFAGTSNRNIWRYESAGTVDRPAQGPDGTLYVIEHTLGTHSYEKAVVILDGANGEVKARVPLPNYSSRRTGCENGYHEEEPVTVGPIVGSDGSGYLLVSNRRTSQHSTCASGQMVFQNSSDVGMKLLRLSNSGLVSTQILDEQHCATTHCQQPTGKQLLPDGLGGYLIIAEYWVPPDLEARVTHLNAEGVRIDRAIPLQTRIELIGQGGTAYLHRKNGTTTLEKQVVDIPTWNSLWNLPIDWNWVAAESGAGAVVERNGELAHFDHTGQLSPGLALGLTNPVEAFHSWLGNTSLGLRAFALELDSETVFDRSFHLLGNGFEELRGFGTIQGQLTVPGCSVPFSKRWFAAQPGGQLVYKFETTQAAWTTERMTEVENAFHNWTVANLHTALNTTFQKWTSGPFHILLYAVVLPETHVGAVTSPTLPLPANGIPSGFLIRFNTNPNGPVSLDSTFKLLANHEIGHILGLGDNKSGTKGTSAMNLLSGKDDPKGYIAPFLTNCDAALAEKASKRPWP